MYLKLLMFVPIFLCVFDKVDVLENGLARTPPMGWMSWGYYMCSVDCENNPDKCLDEKLILSVADTFYNEGYQEAGYEYIIIDDCWSEKHRNEHDQLVPDHKRFPNGMKYIADYIHARGLKFGMYTNIAETTCMRYPGSKNHFRTDVKSFATWEVDYLKVDGCFVGEHYLNEAYIELGKHLNDTGRPMVYSCSWPYYIQFIHNKTPNLTRISPHCNLWRNYHDVSPSWAAVKSIVQFYQDQYETLAPHNGPGHWNDPDMLIFGTRVLTEGQSRVQIVVYTMLSAPILLSCDMAHMRPFEKTLLQNLNLIAVGQDELGIMAKPNDFGNDVTLWVKPHLPMKGDKYLSYSFAIVSLHIEPYTISFTPGEYGLNCTDGYTVMDVFTENYFRNITLNDSIKVTVPPEDVIMYSLFAL